MNQGKNLFTLYDMTGDQSYRKAIETIRSQLVTQPRTKEGNFWHKDIYPWQVWLDGTYMAQPFYMEYETRCNKMQGCIDSYKQFMNIKKHMRDEKTGLYYHGYDESREMYWADPVTGCSPNFWLRAMGWFMVAMVDTLERMDEQLYNEYRGIMAMLKDAVDAMMPFQDAESGMFWQVVDKAGVEGNYLETSGSALFAYAVLKGVRLGYLPKRYTAYGEKAFYGTCDSPSRHERGRRFAAGTASVWWPVSAARPPRWLSGVLFQRARRRERRQGRRPAAAGLHGNSGRTKAVRRAHYAEIYRRCPPARLRQGQPGRAVRARCRRRLCRCAAGL